MLLNVDGMLDELVRGLEVQGFNSSMSQKRIAITSHISLMKSSLQYL